MRLLLLLILLFTTLLSSSTTANTDKNPYWNCMQVGHLYNQPVILLSSLQNFPYNFDSEISRETLFDKTVGKVYQLSDKYEPICQDFKTEEEARKILNLIIRKAKRAKLDVILFDFNFEVQYAEGSTD